MGENPNIALLLVSPVRPPARRSAQREALETAEAAAREEVGTQRHAWAQRAAEVARLDAAEQQQWADKLRNEANLAREAADRSWTGLKPVE